VKVSYNWLKEFVAIPVGPQELAERLTFAGIKLEGMEETGDDTVCDFEIVVNRPDWLSINGIAREAAALYGLEVKTPYLSGVDVVRVDAPEGSCICQGKTLRIVLEDPELCPRYCGQIITGVRIGPSPDWLQQKLIKCGLRPVNNVVDITNLVMMELGQPLHAFDYEKLAEGTIRVRRAGDEKFLMIDGKERQLRSSMLVIADAQRTVAVAGVMGGKESEVSDSTTTLLLESAYFQSNSVRKTARTLEMSTDASYRFERGADHNMQAMACRRAAFLFGELAGGKASEVLQVTAKRFPTTEVPLRPTRIKRVLGIEIEEDFVHRTLLALGFARKSDITWEVPSHRVDVGREIDLIEEIARHYGYNRFPDTLPASNRKYQNDYATCGLERQISDFLRSAGIDETSTYSFVDPASPYVGREARVKILNPISEAASELRTSMVPGLFEAVDHNLRHRNEQVRLFEIGRVFLKDEEKVALGIAITGTFRELKGLMQALFPALNYPAPEFQHNKVVVSGRELGSFQDRIIEPAEVQACEIYLTDLQEIPQVRLAYREIILYPFVQRDITLLLPETVVYGELEKVFAKLAIFDLQSYKLADMYKGSNTPSGKIAFTFRLIFQRPDRTLTSEEVDPLCDRIVSEFASNFGAELRQ
jgi:phenylalanyl-tRNA synthetase beta chain